MASLDQDLAPILLRIADADGGDGHRFAPMFIPQNPAPIAVAPYVADPHELLPAPIAALAERGYLDVAPPAPGKGGYGPFAITPEGREAAARAVAAATDGAAAAARAADERTAARLLSALDAAIEHAGDGGAQAGLRRLREGAAGVDASVLGPVVRDAAGADG
ncbi:hypothetical protein AB0L40_24740 [Patulibacter sp. NPDC049589]|uniref:hypothetical protein n=1 Tax=Patulibacter sp. NPDC049589 TaxID=3154731 RepID=UPI00342F4E82